MNREIKFRIWTGSKYKQYPKEHADKNRCAHSPCMYGNVGEFGVFGFAQREDYVLEQFTGLKDKNGREIYEGDIIKYSNLNYKVFFEYHQWVALCPYYHKFHPPKLEYFSYASAGEVIGNIHENPELLKQ